MIYVLVPIHVAFDLAESIYTPQQLEAAARSRTLEWRVLALLTGHHLDRADSDDGHGHRTPCAVLCAGGTLAAAVTAACPVLPPAIWEAMFTAPPTVDQFHVVSSLAAYHARAPPII